MREDLGPVEISIISDTDVKQNFVFWGLKPRQNERGNVLMTKYVWTCFGKHFDIDVANTSYGMFVSLKP